MALIPNPLFPFSRRDHLPQIYELSCKKCDFTETVELENENTSCIVNNEAVQADDHRMVKELPKKCPKCGGSVKTKQVRTFWRH